MNKKMKNSIRDLRHLFILWKFIDTDKSGTAKAKKKMLEEKIIRTTKDIAKLFENEYNNQT